MSDTPEHNGGEVVLFESPDGEVHLDVRLERESIWLSQKQMAELFGRERSVITRHVQRALADDELSAESNMQKVHNTFSDKPLTLYSLDAVISVGHRVNSARGTQFRIWATRTLRDHLLRGYALSETRLREKRFVEIEQAVSLLARTLTRHELVTGEARRFLTWSSTTRAPGGRSSSTTRVAWRTPRRTQRPRHSGSRTEGSSGEKGLRCAGGGAGHRVGRRRPKRRVHPDGGRRYWLTATRPRICTPEESIDFACAPRSATRISNCDPAQAPKGVDSTRELGRLLVLTSRAHSNPVGFVLVIIAPGSLRAPCIVSGVVSA